MYTIEADHVAATETFKRGGPVLVGPKPLAVEWQESVQVSQFYRNYTVSQARDSGIGPKLYINLTIQSCHVAVSTNFISGLDMPTTYKMEGVWCHFTLKTFINQSMHGLPLLTHF